MTKQFRILALAGMGWDLQPRQETGCSSSSIPGGTASRYGFTRHRNPFWMNSTIALRLQGRNGLRFLENANMIPEKNPRGKFWSAKEPGNKFKIWLVGWVLYE